MTQSLRVGTNRAAVFEFVRDHPGCTFADLLGSLSLEPSALRAAIDGLSYTSPPMLTWTGRGVERRFRVGLYDVPVVSRSQAVKHRHRLRAPASGDALTREGATALAETISRYWAAQGRKVIARVVLTDDGIYVVRSDINGAGTQ